MRILVLGGTGAMGKPLITLLSNSNNEVYVTSRSEHVSSKHVHYFFGNAHDNNFLNEVLEDRYDVIIDFMSYKSDEFAQRIDKLLYSTEQYIFFSSSRVYSNYEIPVTENTPRLLDICKDKEYLLTDEYALAKAREENLLYQSASKNWTIIRPYITYNDERLQLGVYEKETWLYRVLNNKTVIFPIDMAGCKTTMTYGEDVAKVVIKLIGNQKAIGETFHITSGQSVTWREVIDIYSSVIKKRTGITMKVKFVDNSISLRKILYSQRWQILYDRLYDRIFDNRKVIGVCDEGVEFIKLQDGLEKCVNNFIGNEGIFKSLKPVSQAYMDRLSGECTPLYNFCGNKNKLKYICIRYSPIPIDIFLSIYNCILKNKVWLYRILRRDTK